MAQPGYPGPSPAPGPAVSNNMVASIISVVFFWPLAIPAIINASRVNERLAVGDVAGAQAASTESKKWSKLAIIIGAILDVLCCSAYALVYIVFKNAVNG
jgi:hypothetical protein